MAKAKAAPEEAAVEETPVTFSYTCEGTSGVVSCTATLGEATLTKQFAPDSPELRERVEQNLAARLKDETTETPTFGVPE